MAGALPGFREGDVDQPGLRGARAFRPAHFGAQPPPHKRPCCSIAICAAMSCRVVLRTIWAVQLRAVHWHPCLVCLYDAGARPIEYDCSSINELVSKPMHPCH